MAKVRTGCELCACISATMVEESIPPDRNAPRLTSDSICPPTALDSTPSSASVACASESNASLDPAAVSAASRADQYTRGSGMRRLRVSSAVNSTQVPGGSLAMPS
ncbi:hypothetical protein D3C85_625710 [compost metagenome]